MNPFNVPNLPFLMSGKVSPKEIEKIMDKLDIVPGDNLYAASAEVVNLASMQLQIRRYGSLEDYAADMNTYVADAVNRRAQLVCFPAFAGLLPFFILPQAERLLSSVQASSPGEIAPAALHRLLSQVSDYIFDAYFQTMSALAARHRVYIMAGSTLYFADKNLLHRAFLFNHRGELIGFQDKASLSDLELDMGILPGSEIRLFETSVGSLSILIGSDANYFQLARIAKNLGARFLVSPSVFCEEYTSVTAALGLNMRVQETKLYGVQSTLCGDTGLGFSVEGGCTVFAPNELLKQKNGIAAKAAGGFRPEVICTAVNEDRLDRIYNTYTQDTNPELMEAYVGRLY